MNQASSMVRSSQPMLVGPHTNHFLFIHEKGMEIVEAIYTLKRELNKKHHKKESKYMVNSITLTPRIINFKLITVP